LTAGAKLAFAIDADVSRKIVLQPSGNALDGFERFIETARPLLSGNERINASE
jgi:hypothetical protein